jgi:hypothetical protein
MTSDRLHGIESRGDGRASLFIVVHPCSCLDACTARLPMMPRTTETARISPRRHGDTEDTEDTEDTKDHEGQAAALCALSSSIDRHFFK